MAENWFEFVDAGSGDKVAVNLVCCTKIHFGPSFTRIYDTNDSVGLVPLGEPTSELRRHLGLS